MSIDCSCITLTSGLRPDISGTYYRSSSLSGPGRPVYRRQVTSLHNSTGCPDNLFLYSLVVPDSWNQIWLVGPVVDSWRSFFIGYGPAAVPRIKNSSGNGRWMAYVERNETFVEDNEVNVSCSCTGTFYMPPTSCSGFGLVGGLCGRSV